MATQRPPRKCPKAGGAAIFRLVKEVAPPPTPPHSGHGGKQGRPTHPEKQHTRSHRIRGTSAQDQGVPASRTSAPRAQLVLTLSPTTWAQQTRGIALWQIIQTERRGKCEKGERSHNTSGAPQRPGSYSVEKSARPGAQKKTFGKTLYRPKTTGKHLTPPTPPPEIPPPRIAAPLGGGGGRHGLSPRNTWSPKYRISRNPDTLGPRM